MPPIAPLPIDWPVDLVPQEASFFPVPNTLVTRSPFSRTQQVQVRGPATWRATLAFGVADAAVAARLDALLAQLDGAAGEVRVWPFKRRIPRGTGRGYGMGAAIPTEWPAGTAWPAGTVWPSYQPPESPRLRADAAQGADSISTEGWYPGEAVLRAGDYIGVGGLLALAVADVVPDSAGNAVIAIAPRLRAPVAALTPLVLERPRIRMRLAGDDGIENATRPGPFASYTISLEESLP